MNLIQQLSMGGGALLLLYLFWPKIKERLLAGASAGNKLTLHVPGVLDQAEAPEEVETFEHLVLIRQRLKNEKRRTEGIDTAIKQLAEDITSDETK